MTYSLGEPLEKLDPEIEKTLNTLRRDKVKDQSKIAEDKGENVVHRPLKNYATPSLEGTTSSILRPLMDVSQFEIKPATISMFQQSC